MQCRAARKRGDASKVNNPGIACACSCSIQARNSKANNADDSCDTTACAPGRICSVSILSIAMSVCKPAKSVRPAVRTSITAGKDGNSTAVAAAAK